MSGTFTVKELIKELLEHDMDEPVFIGLGSRNTPKGSSGILSVTYFDSGITCGYGVYITPADHLIIEGEPT